MDDILQRHFQMCFRDSIGLESDLMPNSWQAIT